MPTPSAVTRPPMTTSRLTQCFIRLDSNQPTKACSVTAKNSARNTSNSNGQSACNA